MESKFVWFLLVLWAGLFCFVCILIFFFLSVGRFYRTFCYGGRVLTMSCWPEFSLLCLGKV